MKMPRWTRQGGRVKLDTTRWTRQIGRVKVDATADNWHGGERFSSSDRRRAPPWERASPRLYLAATRPISKSGLTPSQAPLKQAPLNQALFQLRPHFESSAVQSGVQMTPFWPLGSGVSLSGVQILPSSPTPPGVTMPAGSACWTGEPSGLSTPALTSSRAMV